MMHYPKSMLKPTNVSASVVNADASSNCEKSATSRPYEGGTVASGTFRKSTLDHALEYVSYNPARYLFPIKAGAKFPPLIRQNLINASNDPSQIRRWHAKWPGCNWGLALKKSDLLVVDIDSKAGKVGQETFDWLDLQFGFPQTECVRTPSGGTHRYYIGRHIFALGKYGFGQDIDSPNYVLIAGCTFNDGSEYEIVDEHATAPAPQWFYEFLDRAKAEIISAAEAAVDLDQPGNIAWATDFLINDAEPAIEGRGGDFATLLVGFELRDYGISESRAAELAIQYYNDRCEPPWEPEDLTQKIHNAYCYANRSKIGAATAEAEFADDDFEVEPLDKGTAAIVARQKLERARAKSDKANGIRPRKTRHMGKARSNALKRAAAMATPYRSKSNG